MSPAERRALLDAYYARRELDTRLAGLVREAVDEGSLRDDVNPDLVSRLLFGMVNSLVEWLRPADGPADDPAHDGAADRVAAAVVAIAFEGLDRAT